MGMMSHLDQEKERKTYVFVLLGIPLEKALKSARMFSKFKSYPHQHLSLELLLATPIEQCLQVFGFKEYLYKITGYDFRI